MYQNVKRSCRAIVLLIKPIVLWRAERLLLFIKPVVFRHSRCSCCCCCWNFSMLSNLTHQLTQVLEMHQLQAGVPCSNENYANLTKKNGL